MNLRNTIKYGKPAYAISGWNRRRKWDAYRRLMPVDPTVQLLDVGYSDREFSATDNFIEKHYPYPARITALGIEDPTDFGRRYPDVRVVQYEGRTFPFPDKTFDVVWSNAVVEHVGGRDEQVQFLREVARVGRRAWVTTPNRFFPIEVHTRRLLLHWMPKEWFDRYLRRRGDGWAAGSYMRLLSAREIRRLMSDAGVTSYRVVRNRIGPFTLDFVIVID
jgi:SAM-dependent methyltransferase